MSKAKEFNIVKDFKHGFRAREDDTMLPPGVLIRGSQNVLTNTAGRIGVRKGYTLDGTTSVAGVPILASFDWETSKGYGRTMRAGFLTSAGNDGKLQFRYEDSTGTISWLDLMTGLTSVSFNFDTFWDFTTEKIDLALFVNGTTNIYDWSGAVTTYASSTVNTITKQGTSTWGAEGFLANGTRQIIIAGVTYTYTGGETTTTLTGVTPDPTGAGIAVGDPIYQAVRTTTNASMTAFPSGFNNNLIANLNNQIYVGSFTQNSVYVSKVNNFKDYSVTSPVRVVGEGAIITPQGTPVALVAQEDKMYISAGMDQWYVTQFTLSSDNSKETLQIERLKTGAKQAAHSQALTIKDKNNVVFVTNEPVLTTLGRLANVILTPQTTDVSFPIVDLFNSYDFTDGQVYYFKNFILISVPKEGVVLIYNQTDPNNPKWEAPQILPISRFYTVAGELYGHSYQTSESYKLLTGYNDNGNEIDARAVFSFNNYGSRFSTKSMNEMYVEGYMTQNGTIDMGIQYDLNGCATSISRPIVGNNKKYVCIGGLDVSLGKNSLGKMKLGGDAGIQTLPPKFRVIKTFPKKPFYEESTSFSSISADFQWEIIGFGGNTTGTTEGNNNITD